MTLPARSCPAPVRATTRRSRNRRVPASGPGPAAQAVAVAETNLGAGGRGRTLTPWPRGHTSRAQPGRTSRIWSSTRWKRASGTSAYSFSNTPRASSQIRRTSSARGTVARRGTGRVLDRYRAARAIRSSSARTTADDTDSERSASAIGSSSSASSAGVSLDLGVSLVVHGDRDGRTVGQHHAVGNDDAPTDTSRIDARHAGTLARSCRRGGPNVPQQCRRRRAT